MVEYEEDKQLDGVFSALSDSTRRSILEQLREGPATVGALAEPHDMTFQGVAKHLTKLEAAGLVRRRKEGRQVWCELVVSPLIQASSWIDEQRRFWSVRLDRLGVVLEEEARRKSPTSNQKRDETDGNENE